MKINLRKFLRDHLYNVEFITILYRENSSFVTYDYQEIFSNSNFTDFIIDTDKMNWTVSIDGLGSLILKIYPKFERTLL